MKICAPATYRPGFDLHQLDEIDVEYTDRHKPEDFLNFCKEFKDKEINVSYSDSNKIDITTLELANVILNNRLYVRLLFNGNMKEAEELSEHGIKYFFDYPIDSYLKLKWFLENTDTTDVYITDELIYNLENVSEICQEAGVNIRMVLNRIPSTFMYAGDLPDAPVFIPQDYDVLDKYIDVAEFDCWDGNKYMWNEFNVLYKRWFKKHSWNYGITFINKDVRINVPTFLLDNNLIDYKLSCNHRCMAYYGAQCARCSQLIHKINVLLNEEKDPE